MSSSAAATTTANAPSPIYYGHYRDCWICHTGASTYEEMLAHTERAHTKFYLLLPPLDLQPRSRGRPPRGESANRLAATFKYWQRHVQPGSGVMHAESDEGYVVGIRAREGTGGGVPMMPIVRMAADPLPPLAGLQRGQFVTFPSVVVSSRNAMMEEAAIAAAGI
jgi:hypothetical protein